MTVALYPKQIKFKSWLRGRKLCKEQEITGMFCPSFKWQRYVQLLSRVKPIIISVVVRL